MKRWYVEADLFEENEEVLRSILGDRLTFVKKTIDDCGIKDLDGNAITEKGIFYGSITTGRRLRHKGFSCDLPDNVFDVSYWLPRLRTLCLNYDTIFVQSWCAENFLSKFEYGSLFIKQDKGYKVFGGRKYEETTIGDLKTLYPEELLAISSVKPIENEFRFFIKDMEILTYSSYIDNIEVPSSIIDFAKLVLESTTYDPSRFWTLDICTSNGKAYVLEVNSLMTAGWYHSDVGKIVAAIDEVYND